MIPALSPEATPESRRLLELAVRLAHECPMDMGAEIAVAGSVAHGLADEHSDVELNLWVDAIPAPERRARWLERAGATEVSVDSAPSPAGTLWADALYDDVWIEAGWQVASELHERIDAILAGEVLAHPRLVLAEIVSTCVPIRTEGMLASVKERLASYPDVVQRRLIVESVGHWCVPAHRWALLERGDGFSLAARLADDLHRVLRIVFALNRQWEPDWKWIRYRLDALPVKPDRLADRLDEIVEAMPTETSILLSRGLILDTLDLLPASRDTERARDTVRRSLAERAP